MASHNGEGPLLKRLLKLKEESEELSFDDLEDALAELDASLLESAPTSSTAQGLKLPLAMISETDLVSLLNTLTGRGLPPLQDTLAFAIRVAVQRNSPATPELLQAFSDWCDLARQHPERDRCEHILDEVLDLCKAKVRSGTS